MNTSPRPTYCAGGARRKIAIWIYRCVRGLFLGCLSKSSHIDERWWRSWCLGCVFVSGALLRPSSRQAVAVLQWIVRRSFEAHLGRKQPSISGIPASTPNGVVASHWQFAGSREIRFFCAKHEKCETRCPDSGTRVICAAC